MLPYKTAKDVNDMALFGLSALFGDSKLNPLESQVLSAVSAELSLPGRNVFNKQIDIVNLVQRHADGKEVSLYVMRRGKPVYEEQFLFPMRREVQLADVEMLGGRAEIWLVEGWVFSIHFDKPPKRILELGAEIKKVRILQDPMIAASADSTSGAKRREEVLATIRSKLPDEYWQLVGEGKEITVNDWVLSGIQDVRKIVQKDGNYYLLAEKVDMGAIGVKEGEFSGQLYYLDYGDGRGEKISVGLKPFLEQFDGGKIAGRF